MLHKVGNEQCSGLAFPTLMTKAEGRQELHDLTRSKFRVGILLLITGSCLPQMQPRCSRDIAVTSEFQPLDLVSRKSAASVPHPFLMVVLVLVGSAVLSYAEV